MVHLVEVVLVGLVQQILILLVVLVAQVYQIQLLELQLDIVGVVAAVVRLQVEAQVLAVALEALEVMFLD
jgi:hypothetical protein